MEGYSVTEAASILGVPTERVWELLARGVLSGAPEGETGMRVYLQPRPAPAPAVPDAARTNGDAGTREPERELSPFRELLTEFRNLTERYGQALLALGESRGEVAALRSRVDLLEARMDLRLPMDSAAPMPAGGWPSTATEGTPGATAASQAAPHDEDDDDRPRRRRGHRRATESFAEALARAEDPTKPELPGAAETAAALAALREEAAAEGEHAPEAVLPRELPAAEPIPLPEEFAATAGVSPAAEPESEPRRAMVVGDIVAEDAPPALAIETPAIEPVEPDAAADEPTGAAPDEAMPGVEPPESTAEAPMDLEDVVPEPVEGPADTAAEAMAVPQAATSEPTDPVSVEEGATHEIEDVAAAPSEYATTAADEAQPVDAPPEAAPTLDAAAVAGQSETEPEPEPEAIAWDPERYTVEIIEPDWYAEEEVQATAAAPEAAPAPETEMETQQRSAAAAEPVDAAPTAADAEPDVPSPPERSDPNAPGAGPAAPAPAEETMLWFGQAPQEAAADEGADEIEVVGAAHRSGPAPMPGSRELDDALAALDALSQAATGPPEPPPEEGRPQAVTTEDQPIGEVATPQPIAPSQSIADEPVGTTPSGLLPSVRPPATSASRAYRRLRRIFPG
jgi:hypothetical protein